jgi:hypothetical protein
MVTGGDVLDDSSRRYRFSADGERIVYAATQIEAGKVELFSASLDVTGGDWRRESAPLPPDGDLYAFEVSPTGSDMIYVADQANDEVFELYHVFRGPVIRSAPMPTTTVER